jgi:hypothetical protein
MRNRGTAAVPSYGIGAGFDDTGDGWWVGLPGEITLWNPLRIAWDVVYGSVDFGDFGGFDMKRSGWFAEIFAEYKTDYVTPGLGFWYSSGDDDDINDGSEMFPSIVGASGYDTFGVDNNTFGNSNNGALSSSTLQGTWGVRAQLKDISFVEDLKHTLRVFYMRGTNDADAVNPTMNPWGYPAYGAVPSALYLTEDDSAWEVNLDTTYKIYENLTFHAQLGYIRVDFDEDPWGPTIDDRTEKNLWRVMFGLHYAF